MMTICRLIGMPRPATNRFVIWLICSVASAATLSREPVPWAPDIPNGLSLGAIVLILGVTAAASLAKVRRDERAAVTTGEPTD